MKNLLISRFDLTTQATRPAIGLLILRLIFGVAFMLHGWGKIQSPFSWMGPDAPVPGFLQFLAALSEFGGGLAMILGLLVPLATLGMAITMVVAAYTHISKGDEFKGGWEMAAIFFAISVALMTVGPGRFSLDYLISKRK
jgi:putative oxidoreductase